MPLISTGRAGGVVADAAQALNPNANCEPTNNTQGQSARIIGEEI
jgi:hypothetical protein